MMFSVLMSLLLVGSMAIDCPAGQGGETDACVPCTAGNYKVLKDGSACLPKAKKTAEECATAQRAAPATVGGVDTVLDKDDSVCGDCLEGFSAAESAAADATCALNCAAGFGGTLGGSTCTACTAGTNFSAGITPANEAGCVAGVEECTDKDATPYLPIPATTESKQICGCIAGKYGATCATDCAKGTFLAAGDNTGATCTTWTVCKEDGKEATVGDAKVKQWGVKTKGTTGTDNICATTDPAAPAPSSAAALVIPAFALIAMLF